MQGVHVQVFNACIGNPCQFYMRDCWVKCTSHEKPECVKKAGRAYWLVCNVMAPRDGEVVVDHEQKCKALLVTYRMLPLNHSRLNSSVFMLIKILSQQALTHKYQP